MNEITLKEIVLEQNIRFQESVPQEIVHREKLSEIKPLLTLPHAIVITGIRRGGKSTLLKQIASAYFPQKNYYYLTFEDERLLSFKVSDFNKLYELFIRLYQRQTIFLFDEIQVVDQWESFVRRMYDQGFKFLLTGSNASMLSQDISTKLTGRNQLCELFPFSFDEYLASQGYSVKRTDMLTTEKRGALKCHFDAYFTSGGMPEFLRYKTRDILLRIYDDILYRDIAIRYHIHDLRLLRELALFLLSNIAKPVSYNKAKEYFHLGSVNTVIKYVGYLEDSYLLFTLQRFSPSIKQQQISPKKIYCIDNGLAQAVAFHISENTGPYLENLVFLHLRRSHRDIYYYLTQTNKEIDFLIRDGLTNYHLIQVCANLDHEKTRQREIRALTEAMEELNVSVGYILTENQQEDLQVSNGKIHILPVYQWLIQNTL